MDMLIKIKNGLANGKKIATKSVSSAFMVIILMKATSANFFQITVELLSLMETVFTVYKDMLLIVKLDFAKWIFVNQMTHASHTAM